MCGIGCVVRVHDPKDGPPPHHLDAIPEHWLDTLDDAIKHRGPDGEGRFRDRATREDGSVVDVALIHRRLSILDHEGGAQPMIHDGERLRPDLVYARGDSPVLAREIEPGRPLVAVVFNGCVYNHRALRAELEDLGHVFGTDHSDTEVLVHGWRAWGDGDEPEHRVQRRLVSMHACVVWDRARARVVPMRDPFGEKPLYAAATGGRSPSTVAWSSCAARLPPIDPAGAAPSVLGRDGIKAWIRHGFGRPDGSGCIGEVPPWSDASGADSGAQAQGGAGLGHRMDSAGHGEPLTEERIDALLRSSVQARIDADVPVGVFLSGGIDSSLIARYASEADATINAYTVRMPSDSYDESEHAREVATTLGIELRVLDCAPDPASDLVRLIEQLGLPFGDSSLLPSAWVCRAAAREVRVALSGDGGDELFAGYERHTVMPIARKLRAVAPLIPSCLLPARDPKSKSTKLRRLLGSLRGGLGHVAPELAAIFPREDLARLGIAGAPPLTPDDRLDAPRNRPNPVRLWDLDHYLRDDLLRKTDTASMHAPLEVRCPFLDPVLAGAALGTPESVLMPGGRRKGLLKRVARRYLPDRIVDRPKQGFAIPIGDWFRTDHGDMRQLLLDHLRSSDPFPGLGDVGVEINTGFVERMIREHDAAGEDSMNPWRGRDHSQRLYMLLVLSIWCKWLARRTPVTQASGP